MLCMRGTSLGGTTGVSGPIRWARVAGSLAMMHDSMRSDGHLGRDSQFHALHLLDHDPIDE